MPARIRSSRRAWGWYRLRDDWADRIVTAADVHGGELVLDIGAGTGALTRPLVAAGARVIAVELHPGRAHQLRRRFADAPVTVICADAAEIRLPYRPFRVVANPPYAITSELLRALLAPQSRMIAADLVLQRAVVARYASRLAPGPARSLRRWQARVGVRVPRHAFQPMPRVDSAVLVLRRHRP